MRFLLFFASYFSEYLYTSSVIVWFIFFLIRKYIEPFQLGLEEFLVPTEYHEGFL